ncbi:MULTISPECIES: ABC transporter permease [unclassified Virgibacillus]|uniref:ABC transporter permease n=1 Tax=unclassified Virgibacillus TaxID=2620237 RepID=UPI0024DE6C17|nr:ABC transporter permease [Virgibacillus sp. LDC-1]
MIWRIIIKQCQVLLRNPMHLLLLFGLPLLLIVILGTALSGAMGEDVKDVQVKVAMINNDSPGLGLQQLVEEKDVSAQEFAKLQTAVKQYAIPSLLDHAGKANATLLTKIDDRAPQNKQAILQDDSYSALIEIPKNFTYDLLSYIYFDKGLPPGLQVYINEGLQFEANTILNLLNQIQERWTEEKLFLNKNIQLEPQYYKEMESIGQIESMNQRVVTSKGYYTIGMAVLNVLFIATTIGFYAFQEKRTHVFNRIILANVSRWTYFSAVFISGTLLGFIQLVVIFGFSWIVYGVSWPNISAFLIVTLLLSLAVGGLGMLLTAISYRNNSETITSFFSSVVIYVISLLGGSFYPIGDFSPLIEKIGDFTPNGAGMSVYLALLRGESLSSVANNLLFLVLFIIVTWFIAVISFPKRGEVL